MRRFGFVLVIISLFASSLACRTLLPGPSSNSTPSPYQTLCQSSVQGIKDLKAGLEFPKHFQKGSPVRQDGDFDVNRYFEVLTHLKMQPGYTLDYVYSSDGLGGYPLIYARQMDEQPLQTPDEFDEAKPPSYINAVETDGTPESYLQLSILALMGPQFYLSWHANYNDAQVLCGSSNIEEIISENDKSDFGAKFTSAQKREARAISQPGPMVTIDGERVTVSLLIFTKWGGFIRRTYTINRSFPHAILNVHNESLVEYDCNVMF